MNKPFNKLILPFLVFTVLISSCNIKNDKAKETENLNSGIENSTPKPDEEEIKAAIEKLLFAAGNYNIEDLDEMISDKAMLGISSLKEGSWTNSEISVNEFFASVKERERSPYREIPTDFDIIITQGKIALARADCILYSWGIPQTREINHFTMMKENDVWKFLNISWTKYDLQEEQKIFDIDVFASAYAQAWCSQRPNFVASFFAQDGSLMVNNGEPATGTKAITNVAKSFMDTFPDMIVSLDSLVNKSDKIRFYWTLTGTNDVPDGTGNKVNISGFEEWTLNDNGLIKASKGSFDAQEYKRQLELGIGN
jgi:hypothetical protein